MLESHCWTSSFPSWISFSLNLFSKASLPTLPSWTNPSFPVTSWYYLLARTITSDSCICKINWPSQWYRHVLYNLIKPIVRIFFSSFCLSFLEFPLSHVGLTSKFGRPKAVTLTAANPVLFVESEKEMGHEHFLTALPHLFRFFKLLARPFWLMISIFLIARFIKIYFMCTQHTQWFLYCIVKSAYMTDLPLFSSKFEEKQKYWKLRITQILDRNKLATERK